MKILIRPASESDLSTIYRIEKSCFPKWVAYPPKKLKSKFDSCPDRFFITELNDKPVGYFWTELWDNFDHGKGNLWNMKNHSHVDDGHILYIANVSVLKEARGYGLGKLMMRFMMSDIGKKARYSILAVSPEFESAFKIYQELGYKVFAEESNYYAKGKHAKLMIK